MDGQVFSLLVVIRNPCRWPYGSLEADSRSPREGQSPDGLACAPVADLLGPDDVGAAYRSNAASPCDGWLAAGSRIIGHKIGLTSAAVQRQIGGDRPDFGVLFDDMRYRDGDEIPLGRLLQPKAEAEVAFLLKRDIEDAVDPAAVRDAVALAFPALEIVDSRIAHWRIGITDTVADNASSGVLGPMAAVAEGDVFRADIAPLGTVTARFSGKEENEG